VDTARSEQVGRGRRERKGNLWGKEGLYCKLVFLKGERMGEGKGRRSGGGCVSLDQFHTSVQGRGKERAPCTIPTRFRARKGEIAAKTAAQSGGPQEGVFILTGPPPSRNEKKQKGRARAGHILSQNTEKEAVRHLESGQQTKTRSGKTQGDSHILSSEEEQSGSKKSEVCP